jgi:hypothetical protein
MRYRCSAEIVCPDSAQEKTDPLMGFFLDLNCQVSNHREGAAKLETGRVILRLTMGLIIKARCALSA